jgi:hypothetical protein
VSGKKKGIMSGTNMGFAAIRVLPFDNQLSASFQNVKTLRCLFVAGYENQLISKDWHDDGHQRIPIRCA